MERNKILKNLCTKLSLNHISNSFLDIKNEYIEEVISDNIISDIKAINENNRFILIVGAGASYASTKKLKTANDAANYIEDGIAPESSNLFKRLVSSEIKRLSQIYKLDSQDFETKLFAFNKFFPNEVQDQIKELYNHKYDVSLFYEIIAHMLKHRFLDVVINYNFDELLDNSIEEEFGNTKYHHIYSDGHCPKIYKDEYLNKKSSGLKHPIYIKPHGTISHPSSLRYTRESYYDISTGISELLYDLFAGKKNNNSGNPKYKINLIIVGFSLKSFELNQIIKDSYSIHKSKINCYVFDVALEKDFKKGLDSDLLDCLEIYYIRVTEKLNIHNLFKVICEDSINNFNNRYKPKGIERHLVIDKLFSSEKDDILNGFSDQKLYFKIRTITEVCILILTSDGIINNLMLESSRVLKYYKLFNLKSSEDLKNILESLGFNPYKGYVIDTYVHDQFLKESNSKNICELIFDLYKKYIEDLTNKNDNIRTVLDQNRNEIVNYFRVINKRHQLNVSYNDDLLYEPKFRSLEDKNLIKTNLDWVFYFRKSIKTNNWNVLLTITEKARFLEIYHQSDDLKGKIIETIESSLDLDDFFIENEIIYISSRLSIPWWTHNQHLVLLCNITNFNSPKLTVVQGFYFISRLLSRTISPVVINNKEDLNALLDIYMTYRFLADTYKVNRALIYPKNSAELTAFKNHSFELYTKILKNNQII